MGGEPQRPVEAWAALGARVLAASLDRARPVRAAGAGWRRGARALAVGVSLLLLALVAIWLSLSAVSATR